MIGLPAYVSVWDRTAAVALIASLLAKEWTVSVYDGEEWVLKRARDRDAILSALASTDADELTIRDASGERIGWASLVWGNGPGELISDCSCGRNVEFDAVMSNLAEVLS